MSKIFLTGDVHGDFRRFNSDSFPEGKELNKDDYVIICGDFGGIWDYKGESKEEAYWLNWLNDKPWTTLFVDGNHENFDRLGAYSVEEWNSGKVHKIRENVIHLMRGEVFDLDGQKFLAFGGGQSHDIKDGVLDPDAPDYNQRLNELIGQPYALFRIKNRSWWKQELPNEREIINAWNNLQKNNNEIDYIISHEPCFESLLYFGAGLYEPNVISNFLQKVKQICKFRQHYCGHLHIDARHLPTNTEILFENIVRIR